MHMRHMHAASLQSLPRTAEQHHGPLDFGLGADEQRARIGGHHILCHGVRDARSKSC